MSKITLLQAMCRKSAYCAIVSVGSTMRHDDGTSLTEKQVEFIANHVADETMKLVARDEARGINEENFALSMGVSSMVKN